MKREHSLPGRLPALMLAALAALCLLLVVLIHLNPGHTYYAYAPYSFYILQPEEVVEETIPDYAGVRRTYTFTIPEGQATTIGARLSFYLHHTNAYVEIEDTDLVYDSCEKDDAHIGHTPGDYWVTIPARPVYAGKTVHVTLTPVYGSVRDEEPVFWLIGHEQLLTMVLLPKDAPMLALIAVAVMAGLFLFVLALSLPLQAVERQRLLLIGLIAIAAGLWKLSGLSSIALMLDTYGYHKQLWYARAVLYLFMLVASLLFIVCSKENGGNRICLLCWYLLSASAGILVLLQMLNVLELHDSLIWFGIAAAILHLIVLFEEKPTMDELLWGLPFLLTLGIDFLFLFLTGSMHNAPFFLLWTIVNLFLHGFGFIRKAILRERLLAVREAELRDVKVQAMVQQIRPHFIYNTLTSIYVLCREDPQQAMKVISEFSDYLHANFNAISTSEPVSFSDELKHTRAYLAVEAMRYGDNLSVQYDIRHTAFHLPPLTLQPIVENSVKHGIGSGTGPTHIVISTCASNGSAIVTVTDNGPGYAPSTDSDGTHLGLENVRERLDMMCHGTLEIIPDGSSGTRVTMRIPGSVTRAKPSPSS